METKTQFQGHEVRQFLDYGRITGDVAQAIQKSLLEARAEGSDVTLAKAGFALEGKFGINAQGQLWGSTPDIQMALWHYVPTKDFGFLPATPQQLARIYNRNLDFFKNQFLFDVQMIRNPHAAESNGDWADNLSLQLARAKFKPESYLAIPYSAVKPVIHAKENGHLGKQPVAGYELVKDAGDLIKVLPWNADATKQNRFSGFDEALGVPSFGEGEHTFYGLTNKTFSVLSVYGDLSANGHRYFDGSYGSARVVGWKTGEASSP